MGNSSLMGVVFACLGIICTAQSSVISVDWKIAGDNLITRDATSGLDWLDLTETNNISRTSILPELESGGQFDGWRYATSEEVVSLWVNFGVNLFRPDFTNLGHEVEVILATEFLGNTACEYNCDKNPYGALGMTGTPSSFNPVYMYDINKYGFMGARHFYSLDHPPLSLTYYQGINSFYEENQASLNFGHYLVQASSIPEPATIMLFSLGLLGLLGIGRLKAS